jgi:hypothetical protein
MDIVSIGKQNLGTNKVDIPIEQHSDNSATPKEIDAALGTNLLTDFKPSLAKSGFRVDLVNEDGAGYIGTIYIGE